jgi:DNA repair exonuclease SbcCD nuclease subunit
VGVAKMTEIKIGHCADIHLSTSKNLQQNRELKQVFFKILSDCVEEKIQLLLIAGDMFDDTRIDEGVLKEIKMVMGNAGFKIVISPGNHDPFTIDSPYNSDDWPKNIYIFNKNFKKNGFQNFYFEDLNVRVWGSAFTSMYSRVSPLEKFSSDMLSGKEINIGLFHADLQSAHKLYAPITAEQIASTGLDYLALGHFHKRSELNRIGRTFYAYAGCPQGRGFDEIGEKGFYIGKIAGRFAELMFKPTCKSMFLCINVDISGSANTTEICGKIKEKLILAYGEQNFKNHLYKIRLIGELPLDYSVDIKDVEMALDDIRYVKIIDDTEPCVGAVNFNLSCNLKGTFIKSMQKRIAQAQNEEDLKIEKQALKLGLKAFLKEVKLDES